MKNKGSKVHNAFTARAAVYHKASHKHQSGKARPAFSCTKIETKIKSVPLAIVTSLSEGVRYSQSVENSVN